MDDKLYLQNGILGQLKETATNIFNLFSDAYQNLDNDVEKAEEEFNGVIFKSSFLLKSMPYYNDLFIDLDRSEDIFYIIQILSLNIKACHNLVVIANHNHKSGEEIEKIDLKEGCFKSVFYFYYRLASIQKVNDKVKAIIDVYYKDVSFSSVDIDNGKIILLEFLIKHSIDFDENDFKIKHTGIIERLVEEQNDFREIYLSLKQLLAIEKNKDIKDRLMKVSNLF